MLRIAVRWKSCGIRLGQPAAQSTLCHSSGKTSDATALVTNACRTVLQYLDAKPSRKVLDAPTSSPGVGFHAAPTVICTQGLDSGANSKVHTALGMSSCRKPAINPILETSRDCPVNGTVGKRVELLTVKALLRESAPGGLNAVEHHSCSDPTCDVVYSDSGGTAYVRREVRRP